MTVEAYLWFEIVKNIMIIVLICLFVLWIVISIVAENEKRKAFKGLQKGFHIEFINTDSEKNVNSLAESLNEHLKSLEEKS
ncbi:hypothetical protein P4562_17365 [Lysinibacillus xylanilyticus]|uniref:hypothetical protein n=1 Tax=Lysinibacillus xylanilyticus TaxID=582475 RepID=UPI002E225DA9|nr:hypothetical protein [Lysinibacillus xylanilyticus]